MLEPYAGQAPLADDGMSASNPQTSSESMSIILNLPIDLEDLLRRRAAAANEDVATFVSHVLAGSLDEEEHLPHPIALPQKLNADWMHGPHCTR